MMQDVEQQISKEEEDHFPSDAPVEAGGVAVCHFPIFSHWLDEKEGENRRIFSSAPGILCQPQCTYWDAHPMIFKKRGWVNAWTLRLDLV